MNLRIKILTILFLSTNYIFGQLMPQLSTFAGNGLSETSDGVGLNAKFDNPSSICRDGSNNLYVVERTKVKKITPSGTATTIFNIPNEIYNPIYIGVIHVDGFGNIYLAYLGKIIKITGINSYSSIVGGINSNGDVDNNIPNQGSNARFYAILSMCSDIFGNLYVTSTTLQNGSKIRKVNPFNQTTSTLYDNTSLNNGFAFISALSFDNNANLIFNEGCAIKKINLLSPNTPPQLIAGNVNENNHVNATGSLARFSFISSIQVNSTNEIYVMEAINNNLFGALQLLFAFNNIDYSSKIKNTYLRKIDVNGTVTDFLGGERGFKDAVGKDGKFDIVNTMCLTSTGDFYIADGFNNRIRKIAMVTPPPAPTPVYIDMPANLCLGSSVSQQPSITGSELQLKIKLDTIICASGLKATTRNKNFLYTVDDADQINKYNLNGTFIETLPIFYGGTTAIAADSLNRVYVVAADNVNPSLTTVYRTTPSGSMDFSWNGGQTNSMVLNNVSTIAIGPDNIAYVSDTTSGFISQLDTLNADVINLPFPNDLQLGYEKPVSMCFDFLGDLWFADLGKKMILKRNKENNNYYSVYPGLENENLKIDGLSIDNTSGSIYLLSSVRDTIYVLNSSSELDTTGIAQGFTNQFIVGAGLSPNQPVAINSVRGNQAESIFISSNSTDQIKQIMLYNMKISPKLPAGLLFDELSGTIKGTPLVTAPYTTYTITTYGPIDSTIVTISFAVDPSSLVTNAIGNKTSPILNVEAGLSVNFYDQSGCEPLANITPVTGAKGAGNIQVTQNVTASLPSFTTGGGTTQFIRRQINVSSQNPDTTNVNMVMYFTYQDIEHYNGNNGAQSDLTNDTLSGNMNMAILQFHERANGSKETITHNITAKWDSAKKVWKATVKLNKFSSFLGTSQDALTGFDCESQESYEFAFGCKSADFDGVKYYSSGSYDLNYINQYGCDSIVHLSVFIDNDVELGIYGNDTLRIVNPASPATFQWVSCDNNYAPIAGATLSTLVCSDTGNYAVIVTTSTCTDTSNCAYINFFGIAGINDAGEMYTYSIFPNPSKGIFNFNSTFSHVVINVYNSIGLKVAETESNTGDAIIDLNVYPSGIYLFKLQTDSGIIVHRVVKE